MTRPDPIPATTARALGQHPVLSEGCVVAVSGGPDSVALLHAVVEVFRENGSGAPLIVGHINHGLRGAESDDDEAFVRQLFATLAAESGRLTLQLACTKIDVPSLASSQKANIEALARKLRYAWLAEQARSHAVRWVLTGHTVNDQAETTLFHILRGTGIRGLRGMRAVRRLSEGVWLMRPLLALHKAEVLSYLNERGIAFRFDSSNQDLRLTRNRIRHDLLPKLQEEYNVRIHDALAALAKRAEHACHVIDVQVRKILEKVERPRVESLLIFDRAALQHLSLEVLQSLYTYVWRREGWARGHMGQRAWERLARWTKADAKAIDLPEGIQGVKKRSVVQLGPRK